MPPHAPREVIRMPIHDWTRAPSGYFHHFHQRWAGAICDALNDRRLPQGYFALVEQRAIGLVPDVLTLSHRTPAPADAPPGAAAVAHAPRPKARFVTQADPELYAARANRVAVRGTDGEVVAVIEIVSPGNKDSRHALRAF